MKAFRNAVIVLVIYLAFVFMLYRCASANEIKHDGPLSPETVVTWVEVKKVACSKGHMHVLYMNPDQEAHIKGADTIFIPYTDGKFLLIAYSYMFGGQRYIIINDGTGYYRMVQPKLGDA